ncbi:MAG: hypothetical protein ABEH35_00270 [Haloarculaceae archaeon]
MSEERPRGILSPADRAFLRGEADLDSEQSVYDARYRIRQRVQHALLDFTLLFERLDERDIGQVFDPGNEHERFTDALVDAFAFLAFGTAEYDPPRETLLSEGVRRAERRRRRDPVVTAEVSVQHADEDRLERVLECIESGQLHELTDAELRAFAQLCGGDCDRAPRAVFEEWVEKRATDGQQN